MVRASSLAIVAFVALGPAAAEERLVLLGGGPRPREAMTRFVEWAGGRDARVLVVPWASSDPKGSAKDVVGEVVTLGAGQAESAPRAPLKEKTRAQFLTQLAASTGVFFTGGDQGRIMDVLRDDPLLVALCERFREGIVFAGTSAGTAAMSARMITGNGDFTVIDGTKVETRPGLGLLPGVIVDQHFGSARTVSSASSSCIPRSAGSGSTKARPSSCGAAGRERWWARERSCSWTRERRGTRLS